jgi:uncharacterized protein YdeI (YjbR/CyaY-like superfamily)
VAQDELATLSFPSQQAWHAWLEAEHARSPGIWLKIARKGAGIASVTYEEALETALCYGWIDGQKRKADAEGQWLQRFTPRRPRSRWSRINREKATELMERGLMQPAGLREVERARADGRWDAAYEAQSAATVPDDLRQALADDPAAGAAFAELDARNRYAILYRIQDAKRPETRARRVRRFVEMLAAGDRLYP